MRLSPKFITRSREGSTQLRGRQRGAHAGAGADAYGVGKVGPRAPDLSDALLSDAYLRGAYLRGADRRGAYVSRANLHGATLGSNAALGPDYAVGAADLSYADLSEANLSEADLSVTDLTGVNLRQDALGDADLSEADLSEANLENARQVTNDQLAEAYSLEGATMPDGQTLKSGDNPTGSTFNEWLKSKGRGKSGQNSGPS
jgi:uncharacterized protein YjbI with pentapeptide repeats